MIPIIIMWILVIALLFHISCEMEGDWDGVAIVVEFLILLIAISVTIVHISHNHSKWDKSEQITDGGLK